MRRAHASVERVADVGRAGGRTRARALRRCRNLRGGPSGRGVCGADAGAPDRCRSRLEPRVGYVQPAGAPAGCGGVRRGRSSRIRGRARLRPCVCGEAARRREDGSGCAGWSSTPSGSWQASTRPRGDRWLSDDPLQVELLLESFREYARQGAEGYAWEAVAILQPWSFRLADISMPSRLWHGAEDPRVPLATQEFAADTIPDARLTIWPDAGSLRRGEVLERCPRSGQVACSLLERRLRMVNGSETGEFWPAGASGGCRT